MRTSGCWSRNWWRRAKSRPDHARGRPDRWIVSFVERGIPGLRVVAGFHEPHVGARYRLTAADTLDKVAPSALKAATPLATELVWSALASPKRPGRATPCGRRDQASPRGPRIRGLLTPR